MESLSREIEAFLDIGYGDGSGCCNGYGNGYGDGYGCGNGYGDGYGCGNGDGYGYGSGYGDGNGYGIKEYEGYTLYTIDNVPTAITSIRGNIAKGFTIVRNSERKPCYIVKDNSKFAHGDTLHDAFRSLQEKLYDNSTEEQRLQAFIKKFPEYDKPYSNEDLFTYHHVLTGSCRMGRQDFCTNHGIDLSGKTTVRKFVTLTMNSYGGDIIMKLPKLYEQ